MNAGENEYTRGVITKPTKYTPEFVLQEVKSILSEVREDQNVYYLWQVFEKREYSIQRFSEWSNTFSSNEEISEAIKKIKEILETRVVVGAMKKELHVTMTIFHLKNNYKWTDKVETGQSNIQMTVSDLLKMIQNTQN